MKRKYLNIQFGLMVLLQGLLLLVFVSNSVAQQSARPSSVQARQTIERIFAIYGIEVDEVAQNAFTARARAIANAEQTAFRSLLNKIVPSDDVGLIGDVTAAQINEMIQSYEIVQERSSSRRYIAELNMQFNPSKVREFLGLRGIRYSEIGGGPVLLLPIFETEGVLTLFEEKNVLRNALLEMDLDNYLIEFVLPEGTFHDRTALSATWIVNEGAYDSLSRYAEERGISQISVLRARVTPSGGGVEMSLERLNEHARPEVINIARRTGEEDVALIKRAAEIILGRQNLAWKSQTLTRFGEFSSLSAFVHIQNVQDWVDIRGRINRTPVVREFMVEQLSIPLSKISLRYLGVPEQLILSLRQVGVQLKRTGDEWEIGLGDAETPVTDNTDNQMN